jgi:5-methylthioribose kinase
VGRINELFDVGRDDRVGPLDVDELAELVDVLGEELGDGVVGGVFDLFADEGGDEVAVVGGAVELWVVSGCFGQVELRRSLVEYWKAQS